MTITTDRGSVRRYIPVRNTPVRVSVAPGKTCISRSPSMQPDPTQARESTPGCGNHEVAIPGITFQPAMQLPSDELAAFSGAARAPPIAQLQRSSDQPKSGLHRPDRNRGTNRPKVHPAKSDVRHHQRDRCTYPEWRTPQLLTGLAPHLAKRFRSPPVLGCAPYLASGRTTFW